MEATYKKYGYNFPVSVDALNVEMFAFRYCLQPKFSKAMDPEGIHNERGALMVKHGLGAPEHFKNICKVLFPKFIWHPIADAILDGACRTNYLGVAGCSHIGKSQIAAMWGIVNFIVWPSRTLVLMTSESLAGAKQRVWGAVEKYWRGRPGLPGKIVTAPSPAIKMMNEKGKIFESRGIFLIPSEKSKTAELGGKMKGMKAERLFLVADELPLLAPVLVTEALSNLTNNDFFHMMGLGNPQSYYDPFGRFVEPEKGWDSITVESDEWKMKNGGICLHFDALKSPNWVLGEDVFPILKCDKIESALAVGGQNTLSFWSQYRGFWPPSGASNAIYAESDIERFGATKPAVWGDRKPVMIGGFDLALTVGGDKSVLVILKIGTDSNGLRIVEFVKSVPINQDVTNKTESRDFQLVRQLRQICEQEGVAPENLAIDSTGAGNVFGSLIEQLWSKRIMRVQFGGRASENLVVSQDNKKASEVFVNRVSEIWWGGVEYLRSGQFRGLSQTLVKEITTRKYEYQGMRIQVEPKSAMKARGLDSPDESDAFFIALTLARERMSMVVGGSGDIKRTSRNNFRSMAKKFNRLYIPKK